MEMMAKPMNMSQDDKRQALSGLLKAAMPKEEKDGYGPSYCGHDPYVRDMYDTHLVFSYKDKTYKVDYGSSDGKYSLSGKPIEVRQVTTYEPVTPSEVAVEDSEAFIKGFRKALGLD